MLDKITLKNISSDNAQLPKVIKFAIGNADASKISIVIKSYEEANNRLMRAYLKCRLISVIGYLKEADQITIRHISILPELQKQGIGTLCIDDIKQRYPKYKIIAETDEESVAFYLKCGFICNGFQGRYDNLRYKCEFRTNQ